MKTFFFTTLALVISSFFLAPSVFAQTEPPCGNIVIPANFYNGDSDEEIIPILNCDNPFNKTEILNGFKINGNLVNDGVVITTPEEGWNKYGFEGDDFRNGGRNGSSYYLHVEGNYIAQKVEFLAPTENEITSFINNFFSGQPNLAEKYIEIYLEDEDQSVYFQDENYEFIIDPVLNRKVIDVYQDIILYIDLNYTPKRIPLKYGTYTIVEFIYGGGGPIQSNNNTDSIFKKIASYLLPIANAQSITGVKTLTFSLVAEDLEPVGASSVLFLPGIQASRLYLGEDGVGGSAFERVWEPGNNSDVRALAMNQSGESIQKLYSADILKTITTDLLFGYQYESGSVYQGFLILWMN